MVRKVLFLARVTALLALTRVLLPLLGLKSVRRLLAGSSRRSSARDERSIVRMVLRAARFCPIGSTCLTRAITAQYFLRRAGIESRLCIGVMRDDQKAFQAHAWLERDGRVILGGSHEEIRQWIPLSGVDERMA
jgi:hypothetical protein